MSNRIIKEQVITSESLAAVSAEAERVYWRLVVMGDDWGWMSGDPVALRPQTLPRLVDKVTIAEFEAWLDELLAGEGPLVEMWLYHGKPYLRLTGAAERNGHPIHFTVRASKSKHAIALALESATRVRRCEQLHATARSRAQVLAPANNCSLNGNGNENENGNVEKREMPADAGAALSPLPAEPAPKSTKPDAEPAGAASGELVLDGGGGAGGEPSRKTFEAWWTLYRTMTGRGTDKEEAWAAYRKIPATVRLCLRDLTQVWFDKRSRLAAAKLFVPEAPDPKRFLKKHRWEDELEVPAGVRGATAPGGEGRNFSEYTPDEVIGDDDDGRTTVLADAHS